MVFVNYKIEPKAAVWVPVVCSQFSHAWLNQLQWNLKGIVEDSRKSERESEYIFMNRVPQKTFFKKLKYKKKLLSFRSTDSIVIADITVWKLQLCELCVTAVNALPT